MQDSRSPISLRPYQLDAVAAVQAARQEGLRRVLVELPTGAGKTLVFSRLIANEPGRCLVVVHRHELVTQAVEKLALVAPGLEVGVVEAKRDEVDRRVVVASVQTLARAHRRNPLRNFDLIVVDEAHHAAARSYRTVLGHFRSFTEGGPFVLGVTATPERADGVGLGAVFERIAFRQLLPELIAKGYLVDLRGVRVEAAVDFDAIPLRGGDFDDQALGAALTAAGCPELVARAWEDHAEGRTGLVFTPTVALAEASAGALRGRGIAAEAVSGSTPAQERAAILRRLRSGETRVVANCAVLTEGFDEPSVGAVMIARPTRSHGFYTQMLGRVTRPWPGKVDGLIVDLVAASRHNLVNLSSLTGLPPGLLEKKGAVELLGRLRTTQAPAGSWAAQLAAGGEFEVFSQRPRLHWVRAGEELLLSVGDAGYVGVNSLDRSGLPGVRVPCPTAPLPCLMPGPRSTPPHAAVVAEAARHRGKDRGDHGGAFDRACAEAGPPGDGDESFRGKSPVSCPLISGLSRPRFGWHEGPHRCHACRWQGRRCGFISLDCGMRRLVRRCCECGRLRHRQVGLGAGGGRRGSSHNDEPSHHDVHDNADHDDNGGRAH